MDKAVRYFFSFCLSAGILLTVPGFSLAEGFSVPDGYLTQGESFTVSSAQGKPWEVTLHPLPRSVRFLWWDIETLQRAFKAQGEAVRALLGRYPDGRLEKALSRMSGQADLRAGDLDGRVEVTYAGYGMSKLVSKVSFGVRGPGGKSIPVAMKVPRISDHPELSARQIKSIRSEYKKMRELSEKDPDLLPRLGPEILTSSGPVIFMQWIDGSLLSHAFESEAGRHRDRLRFLALKILLRIYRLMGWVPADIQPSNFMVESLDLPGEKVVLIDFHTCRAFDAFDFMKRAYAAFGPAKTEKEREVWSLLETILKEGLIQRQKNIYDPVFFDAISTELGAGEAEGFVREMVRLGRQKNTPFPYGRMFPGLHADLSRWGSEVYDWFLKNLQSLKFYFIWQRLIREGEVFLDEMNAFSETEGGSFTVASRGGASWQVKIHPLPASAFKRKWYPAVQPLNIRELFDAYGTQPEAIREFLSGYTDDEFEKFLRHMTGRPEIALADLNRNVEVTYLAYGLCKLVSRVSFGVRAPGVKPVNIAMKVPSTPEFSDENKAEYEKMKDLLEQGVDCVPRLGPLITISSGAALFQQWVEGASLEDLLVRDRHRDRLRALAVRNIFRLFDILGFDTADLQPRNVMVEHLGSPQEKVVFVDLHLELLDDPWRAMERVYLEYGPAEYRSEGFLRNRIPDLLRFILRESVRRKNNTVQDRVLFDAISDEFGAEKTEAFLKRIICKKNTLFDNGYRPFFSGAVPLRHDVRSFPKRFRQNLEALKRYLVNRRLIWEAEACLLEWGRGEFSCGNTSGGTNRAVHDSINRSYAHRYRG